MRIALYVPSWPPGSAANGIVTYAAELVPALRQLGHEVFILTFCLATGVMDAHAIDLNKLRLRRSVWSRITSRIFPQRFVFDAPAGLLLSALKKLNTQYRLDVLEIEESFGWGLWVAKAGFVPVVLRLHGPWFLNGGFDENAKFSNPRRIDLEGRAIGAATVVTAPSADVLAKVRSHYNLGLNRARVIANPIDIDTNAVWHLMHCDTRRILYVGRFDRRKGGDIVLRAFAKLAEIDPDLRLSFVGPDNGVEENSTRLSFEQFVGSNLPAFCRSRIDFYGQLSHREVMTLRKQHLFTIVASQFEILPYSVLEAMSLGCPIIASDVGGIPELIKHEKNGLLFSSQDVAGLTVACRRLLDDPEMASSLGSQAKTDCATFYNPQQIAVQTISAYQAAIDLHQPGPVGSSISNPDPASNRTREPGM